MASVADDIAREDRIAVREMRPAERIEHALALGDDDLALFAAAEDVDLAEARRRLALKRQMGRRPSAYMRVDAS